MITILEQAESYRRFAQRKANAHYFLSEKNKNKHILLGMFVTLFNTIIGTAIFTTISRQESSDKIIQILIGFLSVGAAVLSAFQTFFRFSEISQQHKSAAVAYESIRRQLDIFLLTNSDLSNSEIKQSSLNVIIEISSQLNNIAETAPTVPDSIWDAIKDKINMTPIIDKRTS